MSTPQPIQVLFICTMNRWRSPTAEKMFERHRIVIPRSRGTSSKAKRTLSAADLQWADQVFAMEHKHRQFVLSRFPQESRFLPIQVLNIPDEYRYLDPALVQELRSALREAGLIVENP